MYHFEGFQGLNANLNHSMSHNSVSLFEPFTEEKSSAKKLNSFFPTSAHMNSSLPQTYTPLLRKQSYKQNVRHYNILIPLKGPWTQHIYLFKVNNRNTRTGCEICSKLIIKTPEQYHLCRSSAFIVNFEHISHLFLVFPLLTLNK